MPGPGTSNLDSELNIIIQFGSAMFTHADLLEFEFFNTINTPPKGQFLMIDKNTDLVKTKSGDYGVMIFTNTSDDKTEKFCVFPFIVDEIIQEDVVAANAVRRILWKSGNPEQLKKRTRSFSGTSVDNIEDILDLNNAKKLTLIPSNEKPTDLMVWRHVQENMLEQLDSVVSKSFYRNDYLFWAWDDVNNAFKVSSLNLEMNADDKYVFLHSFNSLGDTTATKTFIDNPNFTIWQFDKQRNSNDIGRNRDKMFPNVSFSGIRDTELLSAGLRNSTFSEMLREIKDKKYNEVLAAFGMDPDKPVETVFGDLKIKRHYPNNVHKMYSFADIYRDYKLATYCKTMYLPIYNNVGPPIGSKVSVIKAGDDFAVRGMSIDPDFSDAFIVEGKYIVYDTVNDITSKGPKSSNKELVTVLKLMSDNFAGNGIEHTTKILEQLKIKAS